MAASFARATYLYLPTLVTGRTFSAPGTNRLSFWGQQRQRGTTKTIVKMYSTTEKFEGRSGKTTAPYGSWKSPLSAEIVSGAGKRLGDVAIDGECRLIILEGRPAENGQVSHPMSSGLRHVVKP